MAKIEDNTATMQAILAAVNALPEAGGGGVGGSIETCTITITHTYGTLYVQSIMATTFTDGNMSVFAIEPGAYRETPVTIENVVCNSGVHIHLSAGAPVFTITGDGDTELVVDAYSSGRYFRASSIPGSTNTISVYDNS